MYVIKKFNKHFKYAITAMFIMATITTSSFQMINAQINPIADPPADWAFETSSQGLNDIIIEEYPNIDINKDGYISIEEANNSLENTIVISIKNLKSTLNGIHHFTNVTRLQISNSNLQGEIPKEIGSMNKLTLLNLSLNTLTGEIPKELGNLNNLSYLDLYSNKLTGEIPSSFNNLKSDVSINAENNFITGLAGQESLWDNFNNKLTNQISLLRQSYIKDLDYKVIIGNPFTVALTLPIHSQINDYDSANSRMTYSLITPDGVVNYLENDNRFITTPESISTTDNSITSLPGEYIIQAQVVGGIFNHSIYKYKFNVEEGNIAFNELSANGVSNTETTSKLTLILDQYLPGLTVDNITLSSDKINIDSLSSQTNGIYTLAISGDWNNEDVIDVSIAKNGSTFTPATKQVTLYKEYVINEYVFKSISANGVSDVETTTKLTLTLDQDVADLTIDNITLSSDKINKGTLTSQSNGIYTLAISGDWNNEDVIDVSIAQDGSNFTPDTKQVTLYKERVINEYVFASISANGESNITSTTQLTITLNQDVADLNIDDITLSNNNINKDQLTSQSNGVYTLDISGDWNNEDVIEVTITKDGSIFTPSSKEVSIYSDNNENNIEDKEVDFDKEDDENASNDDESVISNEIDGEIPKTGANSPLNYVLAFIVSLVLGLGFFVKRKINNENLDK